MSLVASVIPEPPLHNGQYQILRVTEILLCQYIYITEQQFNTIGPIQVVQNGLASLNKTYELTKLNKSVLNSWTGKIQSWRCSNKKENAYIRKVLVKITIAWTGNPVIKDMNNLPIKGVFYEQDLQLIANLVESSLFWMCQSHESWKDVAYYFCACYRRFKLKTTVHVIAGWIPHIIFQFDVSFESFSNKSLNFPQWLKRKILMVHLIEQILNIYDETAEAE